MKDKREKLVKLSIALALSIASLVVAFFWTGYVTSVLWAWFAVPFGIPAIGLYHAVGLAVLAKALCCRIKWDDGSEHKERDEDEHLLHGVKNLAIALLVPSIFLLIGWLAMLGM